jgi:hypothetical protein
LFAVFPLHLFFLCQISGSHGREYEMTVLWGVAVVVSQKLTDVSEVLTASTHRRDDGDNKRL